MAQRATKEIAVQKPASVATEVITHKLAGEMASGLLSTPEILTRFDLSVAQLKLIAKDERFKKMFWEAKAIWNGSENVQERIRQKSALLLEDSLMPLYKVIHDLNVAPGARIDAFARLQSIANMQPSKEGDGTKKEAFILNITMGETEKTITIDAESRYDDEEAD